MAGCPDRLPRPTARMTPARHVPRFSCEYIDDSERLARLCDQLAESETIAFDTEFVSEDTYRPQLCLIQVAAAGTLAVIDPKNPNQPTPRVVVDRHPTAMVFNAAKTRLYVVNSNADSVSVIDYRSAGPGSIDAAFDCDVVFITRDSMSMMTEAAISRRPAIALGPAHATSHKDDEAVASLVTAGWLAEFPLATADAEALAQVIGKLRPMQENHLDRLGTVLVEALEAHKAGHAPA